MITLHIKGTIEQAKQAAEKHNVPLENIRYVKGITVAQTKHFHIRKKLIQWFFEASEPVPGEGFPPGTLLMHS